MTEFSSWLPNLQQVWRDAIGSVGAYLPHLAGAVLLLLLGWLLAHLARVGIAKFGDLANRTLGRALHGTRYARFALTSRNVAIAANAVYWLVILMFLTAAAKTARLEIFSIWLGRILAYLPVLLSGGLIIAAGYVASLFVRDVAAAALASGGVKQSALMGRLAQGAVLLTALVIGIDQIGLDVSFLITVIAISLASLFGAIALAFGIGSRDFVANVIAAHSLRQHYKPGQAVRFGDISGEILELNATSVVISSEEGRSTVPASLFHSAVSVLLTPEERGE